MKWYEALQKAVLGAAWLGSHQPVLLLSALVVVAGIWGFVELADEVNEGSTTTVDELIVRAMRNPADLGDPVGPGWVEEAMRDLTGLGGVMVVALVICGTVGFLWLEGKTRTLAWLLIATFGGGGLSQLLKGFFDRPRPSVVPHLSYVYTSSFPSGHAMLSAVVYLTLAAILTRVVSRRLVKLYIMFVAFCLTGMIGFSRVYLGVHYPTDVLAGWTAGLVWATLCWVLSRQLARQGTIEPEE
jgi:undecaprenyl-diphosphatase